MGRTNLKLVHSQSHPYISTDGDWRAQAAQMHPDFLACRRLGHAWEYICLFEAKDSYGGVIEKCQCTGCNNVRYRHMSLHGKTYKVRYSPSPGYYFKGYSPSAADIRELFIKGSRILKEEPS